MPSRYIIFADDDADDLELITGFFRDYDQDTTVVEFKDGKEVLRFLHEFAPEMPAPVLIVLDINMPRMNGKDTLIELKNHPTLQYIPVVIYTTSTTTADEEFCHRMGASWITKSSTIDGVRQTAKTLAEFCHSLIS